MNTTLIWYNVDIKQGLIIEVDICYGLIYWILCFEDYAYNVDKCVHNYWVELCVDIQWNIWWCDIMWVCHEVRFIECVWWGQLQMLMLCYVILLRYNACCGLHWENIVLYSMGVPKVATYLVFMEYYTTVLRRVEVGLMSNDLWDSLQD